MDVAICIDVTSGMQPFIDGLAKGLQEAFVDYASSVLRVKPRLAVVTFSDHDVDHGTDGKAADGAHSHSSCATVVTDFTHDIEAVAKQLGSISATADTDYPECVACGTAELPGLSWGYDALRVAVLIGDAPPHGVLGKTAFASKDRFPDGCPLGHDMVKTGTELEKNRVQKYEIHVEPDATMANDAVKKAFKVRVQAQARWLLGCIGGESTHTCAVCLLLSLARLLSPHLAGLCELRHAQPTHRGGPGWR